MSLLVRLALIPAGILAGAAIFTAAAYVFLRWIFDGKILP